MEQVLLKARQLYAILQNRKLPSYEREILAHVEASSARILGIYGSRGVGKTTLMLQWLKKLLVVICRSQPLELSIEKMTSSVELSKPTLYKFLDYLECGELLRQIPHELKKYKTIRKADKLYLYHPNLFTALCLEPEIGTEKTSLN